MKRCKYILALLILLSCTSGVAAAVCPDAGKGVTMIDMSGQPAKLPCDAQVLMVNFWASWCAPCRLEIAHLIELFQEFKGRGLQVVGVSLDALSPRKLRPVVESLKIPYPVYIAPADQALASMNVAAIPVTIVFDRRGKVFRSLIGLRRKSELREVILELLPKTQGRR